MPELSAFSSQIPHKTFAWTSGSGALSFPATCGQCCHRPPPLCLCFGSVLLPTALARTWDTFNLLSKHPWLQASSRKAWKGNETWLGDAVGRRECASNPQPEVVFPRKFQSLFPGFSNSVRKAYSVLEGVLFRDPCYGCSHSLSSFPFESGIPSFLQHEGRGELVAQNTCLYTHCRTWEMSPCGDHTYKAMSLPSWASKNPPGSSVLVTLPVFGLLAGESFSQAQQSSF